MRFTKVSFAAAVLAGSVRGAQSNQGAACTKTTCADEKTPQGRQITLTCGGSGETIQNVLFANYGQPQGQCPEPNGDLFSFADQNWTFMEGCSLDVKEKVTNRCYDQKECTVEFNSLDETWAEEGERENLRNCDPSKDHHLLVFVECNNSRDHLSIVVGFVVGLVGLAVGASLDAHQLQGVLQGEKRAVLIGMLCQFCIMPSLALGIGLVAGFEDHIMVGVILSGCAPGGTASNLMTYYAKGNIALSVAMSAASTLASVALFPLLSHIFLETILGIPANVQIPIGTILASLAIAVLPVAMGIVIRSRSIRVAEMVEKAGAAFGVVFVFAAVILGIKENPRLTNPANFPSVWLAAFAFQPIGCLLGYLFAHMLKLKAPSCRAVSLETGVQNLSLVISMLSMSRSGCDRRLALMFPLVGSMLMCVNSTWMTLLLRFLSRFDPQGKVESRVAPKPAPLGEEKP